MRFSDLVVAPVSGRLRTGKQCVAASELGRFENSRSLADDARTSSDGFVGSYDWFTLHMTWETRHGEVHMHTARKGGMIVNRGCDGSGFLLGTRRGERLPRAGSCTSGAVEHVCVLC